MTDSTTRWSLPLAHGQWLAASAGALSFVGGAGDFDTHGRIRHTDDLVRQISGALANVETALVAEGCGLDDVMRVKACYSVDAGLDEWAVRRTIASHFTRDPGPCISLLPVPLQPFAGQRVQIQAIAQRGFRKSAVVRHAARAVPVAEREGFPGGVVTSALRGGEFIVTANRSVLPEEVHLDAPQQSHVILQALEEDLAEVGASTQDSVKMEGYYFGTSRAEWAPLARARAVHFREPGPPATVVPCHALYPQGALTRIEVMAMRGHRGGFDKYIPREDCWPERVWDWPIELPYRQAIRLRGQIWLGGQVPWAPFSNSGQAVHPGDLPAQTRFTMSYIEDLLRGFGRRAADLKLMVCYFRSSGDPAETTAFVDVLAECIGGPLPPITLVPQPHLHTPDSTVEIWGVAQA
jgi:enamine deaminase RidA (YjgF/YER057c/UK114 family)